jgi:tripartite-type tricarboxylate transporter receptor subunit TctC
VAELLSGRIDAAMRWPSEFISHVEAGTLHTICVTGSERVSILPDTPTCDEAGASGLNLTMWRGLAAPKGTPPEVIARLQEAAREATEDPAFQDLAVNIGFEPAFLPAEEFGQIISSDDEVIREIVGGIQN